MCIILKIILIAGFVGGVANYLLQIKNDKRNNTLVNILFSLVYGMVASFLVPLFLNTISSNLIDNITSNSVININDILILSGFCLIAALFSDKFISSLSDKIIKKVDNLEHRVEEIKETVSEKKGDVDYDKVWSRIAKCFRDEDKENVIKILKALYETTYYSRTDYGISSQIQLPVSITNQFLIILLNHEFVIKIYSQRGNEIYWRLSSKGKDLFN